MKEIIKAFNNQTIKLVKNRNYIITPLLDHEPETSYQLMKDVVKELSKLTDFSKADKVVGEEDRGGYIAALLAYANKKSLGMVKWFPVNLGDRVSVDFRSAYAEGKMYLYGVRKGDRIILVEDMVDSGGTIVAMIELLRKIGAEIVDIILIGEKEELNGVDRIKKATGLDVKYLIRFSCLGNKSRVTFVRGFEK